MAGSNKFRSNVLVSRLMGLGCPYLLNMEEGMVGKVVLTPGEARARILHWLLDRFQRDLPTNEINTSVSIDTVSLTGHFARIGLCTKQSVALIEGRTSLLQQLLFLESLLDLVEAVVSKEGCGSRLERSCRFADSVCSSERLDSSVFSCSLNLLPADMAHCTEPRAVTTEELGSEAERLTALLRDRQTELHSILQQHNYEEVNAAAMQSCLKTLTVSLGTLAQLVTNFCQSYEAELQPWVGNREPPALGALGPLCKRTATHWDHVSKILTSLQQLEATLHRVQSIPVGTELTSIYPVCHKAQETLQQCIEMLVAVPST